jgi:hypothetical protein
VKRSSVMQILLTLALGLVPALVEAQRNTRSAPKDSNTARTTRVITRDEMLRAVDRRILAERHKIDPNMLSTFDAQVLLSIDDVSPGSPKEGDILTVQYTLTNLTLESATGVVTGSFQSHSLTDANGVQPGNVNLPPGKSVSSALRVPEPAVPGQSVMTLGYRDKETCRKVPGPVPGTTRTVCVAGMAAGASSPVTVARDIAKIDDDGDGMIDIVENEMLARFRPFYRFSLNDGDDEPVHPADVLAIVSGSDLFDYKTEDGDNPIFGKADLAADPLRLLTATSKGPSSVALSPSKSEYYLNIPNVLHGGEADWSRVQAEATGLYGHVVPLYQSINPNLATGYKIEYWQFYAFNPVPTERGCTRVATFAHEADWEGVELVVELDKETIRSVTHHVHSGDVVFDLRQGKPVSLGDGVLEYQGTGAKRPYRGYIDLHVKGPAGIGWAQNNLVRFHCNEDGCTHPVVYIEHGGHASWPTEHWNWPGAASHAGNSHAYLVATPPNLGEINQPMPGCISCRLILGYNGRWGACGDPPDGPPLKGSWGKSE